MFTPSAYGDNCADFYDEIYGPANPAVVKALTRLGREGNCLELGLGTGRTALALLGGKLTITGIESSSRMLEIFRSKPGAPLVRAILGDFARTRLDERFQLIFALVNTLSLVDSVEGQRQCLQNVSEMLAEDGLLVIETVGSSTESGESLTLHQEVLTSTGIRPYDVRLLLLPLSSLDALAAECGLGVRERWRNWFGMSHRKGDVSSITIYERNNG
jgi:SAM-dependent methyltransferase